MYDFCFLQRQITHGSCFSIFLIFFLFSQCWAVCFGGLLGVGLFVCFVGWFLFFCPHLLCVSSFNLPYAAVVVLLIQRTALSSSASNPHSQCGEVCKNILKKAWIISSIRATIQEHIYIPRPIFNRTVKCSK